MMPGQTASTVSTSRLVDLAANIWRNKPRMSEVDCGIVRCLTVLPVLALHSSAAFLQNSKSWPTVPQATVMVVPAALAASADKLSSAQAAAFKANFMNSHFQSNDSGWENHVLPPVALSFDL